MVQHNIYLQSSRAPYFTFEESPLALGQSQAKQLQEIGWQCWAIARLDAEDWQHIGMAIHPQDAGCRHDRSRRQFFLGKQTLALATTTVRQCWKLLALHQKDWQSMTNLLARS